MEKLIKLIELEEGWRSEPYYCSENYPTVGYGFKLADKGAPLPKFSLPKVAGDAWLKDNLSVLDAQFSKFAWYTKLKEERKAIVLSMAYQMGYAGVLKFKKMIKAIEQDDFITASNEMLDSRWARQTPKRANRHAMQLQGGYWHQYYS